jgi:membrane-associated protein
MNALTSLQVGSALSYVIAIAVPALDAVFPLLPSETTIIALGVATAGSTDPRIALLVACCAFGAFLGDNLSYVLGRRFGPWAERRFFPGAKGARRRAWAERSLEQFGMPLIVVCRFIPGGRTAVTLCCGIIGYPGRRFLVATAMAGSIWAVYSFFIGRLGGKAFADRPLAGLALAFGVTVLVSGLVEAVRRIRRIRARSRVRHTGQAEADDPGQDQADRDQPPGARNSQPRNSGGRAGSSASRGTAGGVPRGDPDQQALLDHGRERAPIVPGRRQLVRRAEQAGQRRARARVFFQRGHGDRLSCDVRR